MSTVLDRIIVFGILAEIVFSALAYGTTESWPAVLFKLGAATLLLLWCLKCFVDKRIKINLPSTAITVLAFLFFGLAQSLALTNAAGQRQSLSLDVEATRSAVAILVSLIILFLLAVNSFDRSDRLRLLAKFLMVYGIAIAVFALFQHLTCEGCLYWTKASTGRPFGPFPNRNHFAGYMELLMPVPLAMVMVRTERKWALMNAFAAAITAAAALITLSRAGLLALAAEIVFIVVMSKRAQSVRRKLRDPERSLQPQFGWLRIAAPIVMVLAIAAGLAWIGPALIVERLRGTVGDFVSTESGRADSREGIWKDTVSLIRANPVTGVGLGAFATAFPLYVGSKGSLAVTASHNDYLQILADTGILGGLIGLWFLFVLLRAIARATNCRNHFLSAMAVGSGAGILGILVHSLFDYNLQIPSNALLFLVFVAVIACVSAVARREHSSEEISVRS